MRRKNIIVPIALAVIILIGTIFFIFFAQPNNLKVEVSVVDNGYRIVLDNNLMTPVDVIFEDSDVEIKNVYFDGLRVYAEIYVPKETDLNISKAILSDNQSNEMIADHVFAYKNNITVLIWDNYFGSSDISLQLAFSDDDLIVSPIFQLNSIQVSVWEAEKYFEEILLHSITVGKTSTLFNVEIYTPLDIDRFQIETDDEVRTCVLTDRDSQNYSILLPTVVDAGKTFIIHALDDDGFIIMSTPVSLEMQQ